MLGSVGVLIPYIIPILIFDYPDILRKDARHILIQFYKGGASLISVWLLFAILGLPLLFAYILIGQKLETNSFLFVWQPH
jgi:hypothetical protein